MAKNIDIKERIARVAILFIGLTIAHLGVTLFLLADLGSDPFNVFIQGLFRSLQKFYTAPWLTHGNIHVCISFLIIQVLLIVESSYVKIGTIICMFCGGPIIDFFNARLSFLFTDASTLPYKLVFNALGCVILAFGMTIVIKSEAGTGPNDLVAIVISDKTKKKFSVMRVIVDLTFVVVGFALGGSLGIGTLICAFLVGPMAGIFMPINESIIKKVIAKL